VGDLPLEEDHGAAVAPGTWREGDDDREIVSAWLPPLAPLEVGITGMFLFCVIWIGAVGAFAILLRPGGAWPIVLMSTSCSLLGIMLWTARTIRTMRCTARTEALAIDASPSESMLSRRVASMVLSMPSRPRVRHTQQAWRDMIDGLAPRPIAIIDRALAPELLARGRIDRFLEPHGLSPGVANRHAWIVAVILFAFALFEQRRGAALTALVVAALGLAVLASVPFIWYRLPFARRGAGSCMAGPGWLQMTGGRVWSVHDSTMIVGRSGMRPGFTMRLIGPAGVHDIHAASLDDLDFKSLWSLWTHRDPRSPSPSH